MPGAASFLRPPGARSGSPLAWTGVGAAAVCATLAIVAVAVCWLPVSGTSGHSRSAIHAGLLTFLAALHGGITVDGTPAAFLPLGMMIIVGMTAWRAGSGLATPRTHWMRSTPCASAWPGQSRR